MVDKVLAFGAEGPRIKSFLPSSVTLAVQKTRTLCAPLSWHHLSTAKVTKPSNIDANKPSHTNDTILKPSRTMTNPQSDATAHMLATNMVSFVRRFTGMGVCRGVISIVTSSIVVNPHLSISVMVSPAGHGHVRRHRLSLHFYHPPAVE
ncbi:hypothetical protein TNCV_1124551 [Trichonephila clavipes]|uniref:Uncharacterized protein n=1 Tax=Trichonephila clavipes TaxID=2585209 RepID=A0A8X6SGB2_TRICX|nr:hypothetical protein TNCV_1124551 [Trichonephila clavipes]